MDIDTLPTLSHDSQRLVELHARWGELYAVHATLPAAAFREAVHALAPEVVEHRARLFAVNAELQTANDPDAPEVARMLTANQDAIKFCTVILGEMSAALGTTSLPAPKG